MIFNLKQFKNFFSALLAVVTTVSVCCSCAQTDLKPTHDKPLVVGLQADFMPLEFLGDNGKIVGIDVDVCTEIAKEAQRTLKIEDMSFDALLGALDTGTIDMVASGLTITEERRKKVDFSVPYFSTKQAVIVKKDNQDIAFPSDLRGKKIAVQQSSVGDLKASEIERSEISRFNSYFDAIATLSIGKVDAVVADLHPATISVLQQPNLKVLDECLTQEEYAIAVKKGNDELLKIINKVIHDMKESKKLDAIIDKY